MKHRIEYFLIRTLIFPLAFLPYSVIHKLGKVMGYLGFYILSNFRKKAMSNLAMAHDLNFSQKEIRKITIESFQNMAINCLEMPRLSREENFSKLVQCDNPEPAKELAEEGIGIIFFCGHQSNWDVLFLDGNTRMKGIAIGKAIKNPHLYDWVVKIREKTGGRIIAPRQALKEGLRALKKGVFVGIVGDQGMPDSGYSYPFFGRRAWNSTAPALLAYRTGSPIIVASTRRVKGGYRTRYSDAIWPNTEAPMEEEVKRLMDKSLYLLQESIRKSPGEWLWQHNRWKQQTPDRVYRPFRKDCICIVMPEEEKEFLRLKDHIQIFRKIYAEEHITLMLPKRFEKTSLLDANEVFGYTSLKETFRKDYRFKLIFNFSNDSRVSKHYLKLSALEAYNLKDLQDRIDSKVNSPSQIFLEALIRPDLRESL